MVTLSRRLVIGAGLAGVGLGGLGSPLVYAAGETASWWRGAVIYEIYIRSFQDSNGDGIGDLNGIISRLDYLRDLGVDALWITPFYPSPLVDFGYDISNYRAIDPAFGRLEDFDRLVREAKRRGLRIVIDMVLNHTSDQHPWFLASQASRTGDKADWYVWRDPKPDGGPPNNWESQFGGSAWRWSEARDQYYYHEFYTQQPDLNWRNPAVEAAMFDTIRWWMDRGVSGFRLDAITSIFEDERDLDETYVTRPDGVRETSREYTDNLSDIHPLLRRLRRVVDERPGTVLIGETYLPDATALRRYYGDHDELQLAMNTRFAFVPEISAPVLRARLADMASQLHDVTPLIFFDNHDNGRALNRYAPPPGHEAAFAKLLAALLLTVNATAILYYGEEIGMTNHDPTRIEDVRDPVGRVKWPRDKGRDGERTPMQWNGGPGAGFTTAEKPWLPVGGDAALTNVAAETQDPASILNFYKAILRLRRQVKGLSHGALRLVGDDDPNVLSFLRIGPDSRPVLIACNLKNQPAVVIARGAQSLLSSGASVSGEQISLEPYGLFIGFVRPQGDERAL